jgi:hypothetical protein
MELSSFQRVKLVVMGRLPEFVVGERAEVE